MEQMPWELDKEVEAQEKMPWESDSEVDLGTRVLGVGESKQAEYQTNFDKMMREEEFPEAINKPVESEVVTEDLLPRPVSNMYDSMDDSEAERLYNHYINDPKTKKGADGYYYPDTDGQYYKITIPSEGVGLKGIGTGQLATGAIRNTIKNVGETALSVRDVLTGRDDTKEWSKSVGEVDFGGARDTLVGEGAAMLVGIGAALKATKPLKSKALKGIAAETGMASTVDSDVETLFVGDNAMFGLLNGIDLEDTSTATDQVEKRLNIITDALIGAKVIEKSAKAVAWAGKLGKAIAIDPLTGFFSHNERAKTFVTEMIAAVHGIDTATDPEEAYRLTQDLIEKVKANKKYVQEISDIEGLDKIEINRDTMGAIIEGYKGDPVITARAAELRKGQGKAQTMKKLAEPVNVYRDVLTRIDEGRGGDVAIEKGADALRKTGTDVLKTFDDAVSQIEDGIALTPDIIESIMRTDPTFGSKLEKLTQGGFTAEKATDASANELVDAISKGIKRIKAERDAIYGKIPDSAIADEDAMAEFMLGFSEEELKSLPPDIKKYFAEGADLSNFKTLYTDLRHKLIKHINTLSRNPESRDINYDLVERLTKIKDHIGQDQVALLKETDPKAYQAVIEAEDWYKKEYAPLMKNDPMDPISQSYYKTGQGGSHPEIREPNYRRDVKEQIGSTLKRGSRDEAKVLIDFLSRTGDQGKVVDVLVGTMLDELNNKITSGGLKSVSDADLARFVEPLVKLSDVINKADPDAAVKLATTIQTLKATKNKAEALEKMLPLAREAADRARNDVYNGILGTFFQKTGEENLAVGGMKAFTDIFAKEGGVEKVTQLVDLAKSSGDEMALKGMQAAYARYMREYFTTAGSEIGGAANINLTQAKKVKGHITDILKYGDVIFQDSPGVMQATRKILDIATDNEISKRVPSMSASSSGTELAAARGVTDFVVTQVFGVLNRLGARVRSGTSRVLAKLDPKQESALLLEQLYSDPDLFLEIAEGIAKEGKPRLNSQTKELMWKMAIRTGIYNTEDKPYFMEALDEQEAEATSKSSIDSLIYQGSLSDLEGQMKEAFPDN